MVQVAITQNTGDIEQAIKQALDLLQIDDLVRTRAVAVKPNDTWASEQDVTGVTQPDTLGAVLRYVKSLAPRQVVVTGGAGAADTTDVFHISGMMRVVEQEGVEFFDHNQAPFQAVKLDYAPERDVAGPQREVMINPRVLEYETLISLAQLKLHETATVTLSMKNVAMSYPAADYYGHPRASERRHANAFFEDMHSFIATMIKRFPIRLAIIVGHPAMIGTGPLGGVAVETGLVIASTDALAADVVGARLLGFNEQGVRHLWEASNLGLGEADTSRMHFPGMSLGEAIRAFTRLAYGQERSFQHA